LANVDAAITNVDALQRQLYTIKIILRETGKLHYQEIKRGVESERARLDEVNRKADSAQAALDEVVREIEAKKRELAAVEKQIQERAIYSSQLSDGIATLKKTLAAA
jgi:peptidoglycan hydrolase CwlO-like protein